MEEGDISGATGATPYAESHIGSLMMTDSIEAPNFKPCTRSYQEAGSVTLRSGLSSCVFSSLSFRVG
jgi:hypothetical protein